MDRYFRYLWRMKPKYHYRIVHTWISEHYGKATKCENPECEGRSKVFEYCLIHGKEHEREISNYKQLCRSCHRKYDNINKNPMDIAKPIAGKFNHNLKLGPEAKKQKVKIEGTTEIFNSGKELADYLGCHKSSIYQVLSGKRKTIYGKKVVYASN